MASMRPRVFPAEDMNEDLGGGLFTAASMRPRVFPAEDSPSGDRNRTRPPQGTHQKIPRGRRNHLSTRARRGLPTRRVAARADDRCLAAGPDRAHRLRQDGRG